MSPETLLKFDRNFFTAFVVPALLATAAQLAVESQFLSVAPLTAGLALVRAALGAQGALPAFVLVVLIASILLLSTSTQIIRFYEGYPFRDVPVLRGLTKLKQKRLTRLERQLTLVRERHRNAELRGETHQAAKLKARANALRLIVHEMYPPEFGDVLPTRLGNAIRCFERYSFSRYQIEAITFWPRLRPFLSDALRDQADSGAASLQLFIHAAFVLQLLAGECLVAAAGREAWWAAGAFGLLSCGAYELALRRVPAWGAAVKSGFDLHRRDLLRGFAVEPASTLAEEKVQWESLSFLIEWNHDVGVRFTESREEPRSI